MVLVVKNSPANAGYLRVSLGIIPGSGRYPGDRNGNPFQYSCLEDPMDKRSLAAYGPQGRTESDTTKVT